MISVRSSSMPKFMVCNGFKHLDLPDAESGDAAAEGTAFHEYCERKFKGEPVKVGDKAKNGVVFDSDMEFFSTKVLPHIPANANVEQPIVYQPVEGQFEVTGTLDYEWEEDGGDTLVIADNKYGHIIVEVEENWQLLSYLIGILIQRQRAYSKIKLMVIQPRPHHIDGKVRTWTLTMEQAFEYYKQIQMKAQAYLTGNVTFQTSEKCRYCPAAGEKCQAITRAFYNSVDVVLNTKTADNLSGEDIAVMLSTYDRIKDIFKIKMDALNDLAKTKLKAGEVIQGYGLEPTYKNRAWAKGVTHQTFKLITGIDITTTEIKSPAEAEKMAEVDENIIKQLTVREQSGFKLTKVKNEQKKAEQLFND